MGLPIGLRACCDGFSHFCEGDILERARKDFDEERCIAQLEKLGDTPFKKGEITVSHIGNPFVPVSMINALRRSVCAELEDKICESFKRCAKEVTLPEPTQEKKTASLLVEVTTKEQLQAAYELGITEILTGYELSKDTDTDFVMLPAVKKESDSVAISAKKIMAQNIGQLTDESKEIYGGERLNVMNSATVRLLFEKGVKRVTLSPELNIKEIKEITKNTHLPTEVIAYGRLPVMVMENCVIKSQGFCSKQGGNFALIDRMSERFPIICENCKNILLNSVPLYMADKMDDLLSLDVDVLRLKFTTENFDETKKVIHAYCDALSGKIPSSVFERITRGHFYRGVE